MIFSLGLSFLSAALTISSQLFAAFLLKDQVVRYRFFHPCALFISFVSLCFFYFLLLGIGTFSYASQFVYLLFGTAFVTTAQTDVQTLLISRWTSIYLAPIALVSANFGLIYTMPLESIIGASLGLITLSVTARLAYQWTGQESLGQGDIDFLAFVGAFLGPAGCWRTLLLGSIAGSLFGIGYALVLKQSARTTKLPFGTFLAFGAMIELITQLHTIPFFSF